MHKQQLLPLLLLYDPTDVDEIIAKEKMLRFLDDSQDCFERSNEFGHFTGSCWLENYDGSAFLLTNHRKLGNWFQLGGHADGDTDLLRVAIKEAQEESGIQDISPISDEIFDISVHQLPEYHGIPSHYHYDVRFLLKTASNAPFIVSEESIDLGWFSDALPTMENYELCRMFEKWKRFKTEKN